MPLFAVMLTHGPAYRSDQPLEGQEDWPAHAELMDALAADGFIALGGPLDAPDVLLIIRAEFPEAIRSRLALDPWHRNDLLRFKWISPWTLRLGELAK